MGQTLSKATSAFRQYSTDGIPASGDNDPAKAEIISTFAAVDGALAGLATAGLLAGHAYTTRAALLADLLPANATLAVVYADATDAYNDFYVKSGASGAGTWTATGIGLPNAFADDIASIISELAAFQAQLDAGLSAYGSWLLLPGNAGKTVDDFMTFLKGLKGDKGDTGSQGASTPSGTSTTSLLIGTGSKTFTTQAALQFAVGQFVIVANTATPANYMYGQITAYNTGTGSMTVNVTTVGGSGTFAAWTISLGFITVGSLATSGGTMTGPLITTASIAGAAGFNLPPGADPTSPNNGDIWTKTAGLFFRANGTTFQGATLAGTENLSNKTIVGLKVQDSDGDHNYIFSAANLAADRTIGLPLLAANDTLALTDFAQTFKNKTMDGILNASTIVGPDAVKYAIGTRGVIRRAATTAQVLAQSDNGTEIELTSGGVTVPQNSDVALSSDFECVVFNNSGVTQTVTQGTGVTLRKIPGGTTGNQVIPAYGRAVIAASATANLFKISGVN